LEIRRRRVVGTVDHAAVVGVGSTMVERILNSVLLR
jgi:hypothetical protein